jgi:hypothetical protein
VVSGNVERVSDDALDVSGEGVTSHVPRASIRTVERVLPKHVGRAARRGLLIGALGGAVLGAVATESNRGPWMAAMAAGWGALSAQL